MTQDEAGQRPVSDETADAASPAPSGSSRRVFRGDIQGMRALAVVLVILSHAGFRSIAGGFVGVDVFFVISGFLITGLLIREADRTGRISLLQFYARRARRILPAAVVVLVATCIASALWLPLVRSVEIFKDAWWAAFFGANIRFASVGTDYFAKGEPASPLQHYWSLSVEEQYYVVWPLLLLLLIAAWRLRGRTAPRRAVVSLLGLAVVASLVWSIRSTWDTPASAYFSTLCRAWELGLGSLAAVALTGRRWNPPRWLVETLAVGGMVMIAIAALGFDASTRVPGWIIAIPVVGAALVLVAGSAEDGQRGVVARVLSLKPARVLGDWSYSLYLWHFPVLRIAEDHFGEKRLSPVHLVAALVMIVGLSALTYRFVEEPIRTGSFSFHRPWRAVALYPAGLAVVLAVTAAGRGYVDHRLGLDGHQPAITTAQFAGKHFSKDPQVALVEASVLAAQKHRPVPSSLTPPVLDLRKDTAPLGDCDYRTGTHRLCPGGDPSAKRSIVIVGDSHARAWAPAIDAIGKAHGYATYALVYSGCPATKAVQIDQSTRRPFGGCEDFKSWALATIGQLHPDLVVVSSAALAPLQAPDGSLVGYQNGRDTFLSTLRTGFSDELAALKPLAGRVAVIGNTPELATEPGTCLSSGGADLGDCLFRPDRLRSKIQRDFLDAARAIGATAVDARKWFCAQGRCPAVVGDTITLRDREHVTTEYARALAEPLARRLGVG